MIDSVTAEADGYVECVTSASLPQDIEGADDPGLLRPADAPINPDRDFPSPQMHEAAARVLLPEIQRLLKG